MEIDMLPSPRLIAHRGNVHGPNNEQENKLSHIQKALDAGYDVEIDLWYDPLRNELKLGHDEPMYKCDHAFLCKEKLWIHCKNVDALEYCKDTKISNPYFWHQEDDVTLTSNGLFWTFPGKPLTKYSIAVMPETKSFRRILSCMAICSDYVGYGLDFFHDLCSNGEGTFAFQQIQKSLVPSHVKKTPTPHPVNQCPL